MQVFWVEGTYRRRQGAKKARKAGKSSPADLEPYGKSIWATSAEEALRLATAELDGGEWIDGPRVSRKTEEQRMRARGQPSFPGSHTRSLNTKGNPDECR